MEHETFVISFDFSITPRRENNNQPSQFWLTMPIKSKYYSELKDRPVHLELSIFSVEQDYSLALVRGFLEPCLSLKL